MNAESQAKMEMEGHLGISLGSQFMAVTFDALLCGVILCQCLRWLPDFRTDMLLIRTAVPFGALAAIATTCFTWAIYMQSFVFSYGQYAPFANLQYFGFYPLLDILTVVPVQLVFADRSVKINNRNIFITIVNYGFIILTAASAISITILTRHQTIYTKSDALKMMMVIWPAICTCTHLILTGSILYGLFRTREGANHTRVMVDRIIFMSLESQIPGTLFAFVAMLLIAADPDSGFVPWIVIVHPKVFLIGCIAMVNVRHTWQREGKLPSTLGSDGVRKFSLPPRFNRGDGSSSAPSDTVGTPTRDGTPRTGPIMLSSFDEEDGPGMQLNDLGKPIDLEQEQKDNMDSERDSVSNYKVEHMV